MRRISNGLRHVTPRKVRAIRRARFENKLPEELPTSSFLIDSTQVVIFVFIAILIAIFSIN